MSGLRIRDVNGNVVFDSNTPNFLILDVFETGTENGSRSVPRLGQHVGSPRLVVMPLTGYFDNTPEVSAIGTNVSWVFKPNSNPYMDRLRANSRVIVGIS